MGAAKAAYYQAWSQKMNELKKVDQNAWTWLMASPQGVGVSMPLLFNLNVLFW